MPATQALLITSPALLPFLLLSQNGVNVWNSMCPLPMLGFMWENPFWAMRYKVKRSLVGMGEGRDSCLSDKILFFLFFSPFVWLEHTLKLIPTGRKVNFQVWGWKPLTEHGGSKESVGASGFLRVSQSHYFHPGPRTSRILLTSKKYPQLSMSLLCCSFFYMHAIKCNSSQ